jgi:hypothetical protein
MNSDFTLCLNVELVPHTVIELGSVNDCIVEAGVK